jgi:hypothetical protein
LNYKLETFVYPIPDQKAWAVDAMAISWKEMFNYIFPPFRLLHRTLHKMRGDGLIAIEADIWLRKVRQQSRKILRYDKANWDNIKSDLEDTLKKIININ